MPSRKCLMSTKDIIITARHGCGGLVVRGRCSDVEWYQKSISIIYQTNYSFDFNGLGGTPILGMGSALGVELLYSHEESFGYNVG